MAGWVSPKTGVKFHLQDGLLELFYPDGSRFETYLEVLERAAQEKARAIQASARAEQEAARANQAEARNVALEAKWMALRQRIGIK